MLVMVMLNTTVSLSFVGVIPAGTQRCLRLIIGRDIEQPIFNVDTTLLISTLGKQPIFNVVQRHISTLKQRNISTLKQRQISTLKQRHNQTLKQRRIST